MNNQNKLGTKISAISRVLLVGLTLLTACSMKTPASLCHATGDAAIPYEKVALANAAELDAHRDHVNDIVPAPEGDCPPVLWTIIDGKITICHATGSEKNPYNEITISVNGLNGHGDHQGDIIPIPEVGCPKPKP